MAVPQNRTTKSRRNMRRSHDALTASTVSTDAETGERHRRHGWKSDFGPGGSRDERDGDLAG